MDWLRMKRKVFVTRWFVRYVLGQDVKRGDNYRLENVVFRKI